MRVFGWILTFVSFVALAGCASTATGAGRSALLLPQATAPVSQIDLPSAGTLIVLRYPAVLDESAAETFYNAYAEAAIGGRVGSSVRGSLESRQAADGMFLKSNYFAQSIYRELVERLPKEGVLLSPHRVALDKDGRLTSIAMTEAESIPAVLAVDFVTYSFPDPERMMNSEPITFGDLFTPLVVVHADHRSRAPTHGVVLASAPLLAATGGAARTESLDAVQRLEQGDFDRPSRSLDFVHFLDGDLTREPASQGLSVSSRAHAVQVYPMEKILMDRYALRQMKFAPDTQLDPIERAFSSALAHRIVAQLSTMDLDRASMVQRAAAIERFDPSLSALAFADASDDDVQTRLRFAERLLEAERRFLAVQSQKIHDGIQTGEIGRQMRDLLTAEFDLLQRRRELARQQNLATAAAIAGVVAAGAVAANSGDTFDPGDFIAVDLLTDLATISAMQAFSLNSQNKTAGVNFIQSMVPALEEQITVQVELLDSNEAISAIRIEDFRTLLQERYADSQRSIDTVSSRCEFSIGDSDVRGVWHGECSGGIAAGVGAGVVRKANGAAVEYFGETHNGQPEGVGYMIVHNASGAFSLEGNFDDGQADGVVRVARAGATSREMIYRNGREVGPAPAGQVAPSLFKTEDDAVLASLG